MGIHSLLDRYSLTAQAEGLSDKTIQHVSRIVGYFDDFLGGIDDVSKVTADDFRYYLVSLRERPKWTNRQQYQDIKLSQTSINTYARAIKEFWALASWAKQETTQYFDAYFVPQEEDKLVPATLFHPEYFRSLAIRLYNFGGKAVTPEQTIVISYEEKPFQEGGTVKVVNNVEFFPSYEEATGYISSQKSGQFRIVSDSPFVSPVPLEELEHYKLVYSSPESSPQPGVGNVPNVKIFEYMPEK